MASAEDRLLARQAGGPKAAAAIREALGNAASNLSGGRFAGDASNNNVVSGSHFDFAGMTVRESQGGVAELNGTGIRLLAAGLWAVQFNIEWAPANGTYRQAYVTDTLSPFWEVYESCAAAGQQDYMCLSTLWPFAANDDLSLKMVHDATVPLTVTVVPLLVYLGPVTTGPDVE